MRMLRDGWPVAFALVGLLASSACAGGEEASMEEAEGSEMAESESGMASGDQAMGLPEGFAMRLDRESASADEFQVAMEDDREIRVQTGPAGILWRDEDRVESGDYTVSATFLEYETPPGHREAFGVFIGGQDLQAQAQQYAYFLVRADGSYLIKTRQGDGTSTAASWTQSDAVNQGEGMLENMLTVSVSGDMATFSVNGTEVASHSAEELGVGLHGVAGMRVNHRLNVGIRGWSVESGM